MPHIEIHHLQYMFHCGSMYNYGSRHNKIHQCDLRYLSQCGSTYNYGSRYIHRDTPACPKIRAPSETRTRTTAVVAGKESRRANRCPTRRSWPVLFGLLFVSMGPPPSRQPSSSLSGVQAGGPQVLTFCEI